MIPDPDPSKPAILVVEDEYFLADDVARTLRRAGAAVVGPVARVVDAEALIAAGARIDAAVLDVNLTGEAVYAVADRLRGRGVPFVFATGYDADAIPDRYADAPRRQKPFEAAEIATAVLDMVRTGADPSP